MKKIWVIVIAVLTVLSFVLPVSATRREGITGVVEYVDSQKITIASKTYRIGKQFRVVVATREGMHRSEHVGSRSDIRIGEKVSAVVLFDEITDMYIERY
jgi:hypothetical protein